MNCSEAKKVPITYYLHSIGITPQEVKNGSAWYCSPLRPENKASFKVDREHNIWYDFGTGTGGNILDLVMKLNATNITGALMILQKPGLSNISFSFPEQHSVYDSKIELKHLQSLQNRALVEYLKIRKITPRKAAKYIQEAYYKVNGKQYFAISFKNDLEGYELRNRYFKGSISPKAPTTIKGNPKTVNIFEGFFDFLSALEYYLVNEPAATCIILNSVSNLNNVLPTLSKYSQVNLFLDNDNAGKIAAETIKAEHPQVTNYSELVYPKYKDFNELLTAGKNGIKLL